MVFSSCILYLFLPAKSLCLDKSPCGKKQWWNLLKTYRWLSISRILDIWNFALSPTIYPVPLSFTIWSKQKTRGISNLDIYTLCLYWTSFQSLWEFPCCLDQNVSCSFSSQISLFSTVTSTIAAIVPAGISKDSQINFFCSFFDRMFSLDKSIARIYNKASL